MQARASTTRIRSALTSLRAGRLGAVIQLLGLALLAAACHETGAAKPTTAKGLIFPVQVAPVTGDLVEYGLDAVGSIEAFERIPVTARVTGVVERVLFVEGDTVRRGQVLVEIEIARFVLAVRAAEAALQRAQAARSEAESAVARRESAQASSPGLVPLEEVQSWKTRVQTLAAEERQAQVSLEQAQLNLRDARVRAPEAGVIQSRDVQTGQYVQVGSILAGLLRRDPLLLRFNVADVDAARLHHDMPVSFQLRGDDRAHAARIIHVAAAANSASRMVSVTATVDDATDADHNALRPGAFAQVRVPVGSTQDAPVIPQTAIRASERGFLAFVIEDGTAHERVLRLGLRTADGRVEVRDGLRIRESLVVRGVQALRDGSKVDVVDNDTVPQLSTGDSERAL